MNRLLSIEELCSHHVVVSASWLSDRGQAWASVDTAPLRLCLRNDAARL
jgi:hypothetical protein